MISYVDENSHTDGVAELMNTKAAEQEGLGKEGRNTSGSLNGAVTQHRLGSV